MSDFSGVPMAVDMLVRTELVFEVIGHWVAVLLVMDCIDTQ
jgi:hypothetical protein